MQTTVTPFLSLNAVTRLDYDIILAVKLNGLWQRACVCRWTYTAPSLVTYMGNPHGILTT